MPLPCHAVIEGEKQGKIDGSCDMEGREKTVVVFGMNHDVHIPRDPQSGLPSGKRVHGPLTIVKEYDKSSPKLYQALCTGEHMKKVQLKFYRIDKTGTEAHYFTTNLEDAIVVSMKPFSPLTFLSENEPYRHMEEVAFTYKKVKWTWEPDGVEAEDSWSLPK